MAGKKTAQKTAPKKRVPKHGHGQLLTGGQPGNKGGTGRPPDEFKAEMAKLASSPSALKYMKECLEGKHGPKAFASAMAFSADRGYGKVPNVTKLEGGGAPLEIVLTHNVPD